MFYNVELFWWKYNCGVSQSFTILLVKSFSCFYQKTNIEVVWSFIEVLLSSLEVGFIYLGDCLFVLYLFSNYYNRELGVNSQCTTVQSKCFIIGMKIEYRLTRTAAKLTFYQHHYMLLLPLELLTDLFSTDLFSTDLFLIWKDSIIMLYEG